MGELSYTVGGDSNLVSFKSAARVPITSLKAHFKPKQDLHGYSKPWPAGGGKNQLNIEAVEYGTYDQETGLPISSSYQNQVRTTYDIAVIAGDAWVSSNTVSHNCRCFFWDVNGSYIGNSLSVPNTSFTIPNDATKMRVVSGADKFLESEKWQLEKGSAATSYEPYENICQIEGWTEVEQYYSGKNMGHIVGYSASATVNRVKTNIFGTTINTINYEGIHGEVVVTQTQAPELNNVNHYKNGYMVFYPDNLIWDQKYDISFKVNNIISNPLNTTINNFKLISPYGNQALPIKVVEDKLYFKNVLNKQKTNEPSLTGFNIRICGMSCTISDIMITPADSNEEEYEPYTQKRFVIWNQWLKPLTSENWQAYNSNYINTTFENGTATSTWLTNNSGYGTSIRTTTGVLQKNKEIWYISYMLKSSMSGGNWGIEYNGGFQNTLVNNLDADTWTRCSECSIYWRGTRNYVYISYYRSGINEHTGMVAQVKSPIFINLTQMFGPGNEPTKEEFEEQCTLNGIDLTTPLPYNEGSIREWKTNGALLKNDIIFPVLGKNKFNINVPFAEPNNTAQSSSTNRIFQPYTYCLGFNAASQYLPDRVTSCSITNNTLTFTASNTSYGVLFAIPLLYGTYRISYTGENVSVTLVRYNDNGEVLISGNSSIDSQGIFANGPGVSITGVIFRSVTANEPTIVSNIQIEEGIISTQYEEFDSKHTVYGGYVDIAKGEIVATYAKHVLNGTETGWKVDGSGSSSRRSYIDTANLGVIAKAKGKFYCDYCKTTSSGLWYGWISSTGSASSCHILFYIPVTYDTSNKWIAYLQEHPMNICYELANPIHYPLSKTELKTFLDQNNIWSNTNDITEVSYQIHDSNMIKTAKKEIIAGSQPHIETSSGAIATFNTDMAAPLNECRVYFSPVQEGSSDPSPDNVRAINGWTRLEVWRTGKNLIDESYLADGNNYPNAGGYGYYYTNDIQLTPNTRYRFVWYDYDNTVLSELGVTSIHLYVSGANEYIINNANYRQYSSGFITPATGIIRLGIYHPSSLQRQDILDAIFNNGKLLLQVGTDNIAYTPYSGTTLPIDWTTEAGTIYGGYLDLVNGEVWQTWAYVEVDENTSFSVGNRQDNAGKYFYLEYNNIPDKQCLFSAGQLAQSLTMEKCNRFMIDNPWGQSSSNNYTMWAYISGATQTTVRFGFPQSENIETTTDAKTWLAEHGSLIICYPLVAPVFVGTINPITLKTLRGTNNVWSNTNSNIELKYWTH